MAGGGEGYQALTSEHPAHLKSALLALQGKILSAFLFSRSRFCFPDSCSGVSQMEPKQKKKSHSIF